jgi:hypothetical protein
MIAWRFRSNLFDVAVGHLAGDPGSDIFAAG